MDPSSILALSSVAGTVGKSVSGMFSTWIYTKYKKWRLKKRLTGVLLLKGCTTVCQKLSNSEVLFFDIDVLYRELTAPKEASDAHKEPSSSFDDAHEDDSDDCFLETQQMAAVTKACDGNDAE